MLGKNVIRTRLKEFFTHVIYMYIIFYITLEEVNNE